MSKLRVGVILPHNNIPAWIRSMIEEINNSSHAEVSSLAFDDRTSDIVPNKQYELQLNLDKKIFHPEPDPWEISDIRKVLYNTQVLGINLYERISRLKSMHIDLLLNLSLEDMPKSLLHVARFGAWSLRCNGARVTAGSEIGWPEILNDIPVMHCDIEIQREESLQLYTGSIIATDPSSISMNQASFFWRASQVIPRALQRLNSQGEQKFFDQTKPANLAEKAVMPTPTQSTALVQKQALQISEDKILRRTAVQSLALMAGKSVDEESFDWDALSLKVPPQGVVWSNPFLLKKQNKTYMFFEEYISKNQRRRIAYTILDTDNNIDESQVALERPYHLSYPFIFEHRGEFYMIPETSENRTVEIYHCTRFPDQWEFYKTILPDARAVNTTIINYSMRWWMFVSIAGNGSSTPDELHLFYSDDPLTDVWTQHPMNPIVTDVRSAQTAGSLFRREGGLIRPSRDPLLKQGSAIALNSITKLTIYEYEEELLERIEPPNEEILGVQTYNNSGEFVVMDVLLSK